MKPRDQYIVASSNPNSSLPKGSIDTKILLYLEYGYDSNPQWTCYYRGVYFAPHKGGNYFFHLPPRVPKNGGQQNICPPGSRKWGAKNDLQSPEK